MASWFKSMAASGVVVLGTAFVAASPAQAADVLCRLPGGGMFFLDNIQETWEGTKGGFDVTFVGMFQNGSSTTVRANIAWNFNQGTVSHRQSGTVTMGPLSQKQITLGVVKMATPPNNVSSARSALHVSCS